MNYKNGVWVEVVAMFDNQPQRIQLSEQIKYAFQVANKASILISGKGVTITAGLDGKHMEGSKHYLGNAIDIRKWLYTADEITALLDNLRHELGTSYDIVEEKTHIHIEFDPKTK